MTKAIPQSLVIGSRGFLGRAFHAAIREEHPEALGLSRQDNTFDLEQPDLSPFQLDNKNYQYALILAAKPRVAECENSPQQTSATNIDGTLKLIEQLVKLNITPVFFSSDYVFEGNAGPYSDNDPTTPCTEYGRQKARIEEALSTPSLKDRSLVIRLSKVFSFNKGDGSLLDDMAMRLVEGQTLRAAHDQRFCPTFLDDVVEATFELLRQDARGPYNLCSSEIWSRYDLTTTMAHALGKPPESVTAISLDDLDEGFLRPHDTSMRPSSFKHSFTPIQKCIDHVAKLWQDG